MTLPSLSEKEFQQQVVELAELYNWDWAHFRVAKTDRGWRTPVSGTIGKGWLDLILVRERLIVAELKRDGGKLTPAQIYALSALETAGVEVYVWRPRDWDEIMKVLR